MNKLIAKNEVFVFKYKPIKTLEHFAHIALLLALSLFGLIGFIAISFPIEGILLAGGGFLLINFLWWLRLQRENNTPSFKVSNEGIEVLLDSSCTEKISWTDIKEVRIIEHKVVQKMKPGFIIVYQDKDIPVYQRICGYEDFYNLLKLKKIKGTEAQLIPYDPRNLNIYGEYTETGY